MNNQTRFPSETNRHTPISNKTLAIHHKNMIFKYQNRNGFQNLPQQINSEMNAQLDEQLVHLPDICRVSVRVQQRRVGHGVPHVHRHDFRAPPRRELQYVDVFAVREWVQQLQPRRLVGHQLVARRRRWKKRQLCCHWRRHPSHLSLSLKSILCCQSSATVSMCWKYKFVAVCEERERERENCMEMYRNWTEQ